MLENRLLFLAATMLGALVLVLMATPTAGGEICAAAFCMVV